MRLVRLPRSLFGRVFALYTVTLVAFVVAGLGLFYIYQFTVELEEAQLRGEALSTVIVPTVSDSVVIGDYDTIRRTLERAVYHSAFASASFIDLQGGAVRAPRDDPPPVTPPTWLRDQVAERLYDINHTITVGGRDYGVLRLSFSAERIAGRLWAQTRIALGLALLAMIGGLIPIRFVLDRWLGKLSRVQDFDQAMQSGEATASLLTVGEVPLEFQATFEVLGRAAATLQAQRAQAAVTLGAIADGVFTLDADGRIVLANPAACAMTGRDLLAMHGQPAAQVLPEVHAGLPTLSPWAGRRVTLTARDGHPLVVDTTLSPIANSDGSTVGYVLACRDISVQHDLEQRLRAELRSREAALNALRKVLEGLTQGPGGAPMQAPGDASGDDLEAISTMISELVTRLQVRGEQLDAIFALSPDGFVSFDAGHRVNYASPAFAVLTGIPIERVLGASEQAVEALLRAQGEAGPLPWAGFAAMRRALRECSGTGLPQRELIDLSCPAKRTLEVRLREGSTAAISQVLSLRDVTHETEVDQMKSEFVSTAAHELRTPMASIFGFAELMMHKVLPPEKQHRAVAAIYRQTQLMIAIVNELLDLARIEARRGKDFVLETVELGEVARQLLQDFSPPADRAAPELADAVPGALVRVDRDKLRQAAGNVLSNAYKYSPQGGPVRLRIVQEDAGTSTSPDPQAGGRVGIEVLDQGIGMTPEQLARVGERFYRADGSGNIPGTGLGMSIVREILGLLGGEMAMDSTPGAGTRVTLWLPRAAAQDGPDASQAIALAA